MTEHEQAEVERPDAPEAPEPPEPPETADVPGAGDPVRTGVAGVDAVLEEVEDLEGRPLEEHVAVFEDAHGRLRRALDDPGT